MSFSFSVVNHPASIVVKDPTVSNALQESVHPASITSPNTRMDAEEAWFKVVEYITPPKEGKDLLKWILRGISEIVPKYRIATLLSGPDLSDYFREISRMPILTIIEKVLQTKEYNQAILPYQYAVNMALMRQGQGKDNFESYQEMWTCDSDLEKVIKGENISLSEKYGFTLAMQGELLTAKEHMMKLMEEREAELKRCCEMNRKMNRERNREIAEMIPSAKRQCVQKDNVN